MCWLDGLANPVRQVALAALVFVCVLAVGSAFGQDYIPRGQPIPQSVRWVSNGATAVNAQGTASWTHAGSTTYHKFPVPVGKSTVGAAAKAAVRRGLPVVGWALTLRDIVNGAGWAIDELQKQVVVPGTPQQPLGQQGWCWNHTVPKVCSSTDPPTAPSSFQGKPFQSIFYNGSNWVALYDNGNGTSDVLVSQWYGSGFPSDVVNGNPPATDDVPVSDADLGQLVAAHPEVFNAVMIDPDTGAPIRTPELIDALNDLRRALEAANGITEPGTDMVAQEDFADPVPSQSDWPGFCDWATTVCDFITWFKTDPDNGEHPELPYEEREVEMVPYNSGLGSGQCPASTMVAVLDGEVEISWVGICGFVTYLRPLLIACAWILSAFIVVNARPGRL